jgi:hypothetical protein
MRAITIKAERQITVVAQHAKPIGIVIFAQPVKEFISLSDFSTVLSASAIDMIYSKKFQVGFTAACAYPSVMGYKIESLLRSAFSVGRSVLFGISFTPSLGSGLQLFRVRPFPGADIDALTFFADMSSASSSTFHYFIGEKTRNRQSLTALFTSALRILHKIISGRFLNGPSSFVAATRGAKSTNINPIGTGFGVRKLFATKVTETNFHCSTITDWPTKGVSYR